MRLDSVVNVNTPLKEVLKLVYSQPEIRGVALAALSSFASGLTSHQEKKEDEPHFSVAFIQNLYETARYNPFKVISFVTFLGAVVSFKLHHPREWLKVSTLAYKIVPMAILMVNVDQVSHALKDRAQVIDQMHVAYATLSFYFQAIISTLFLSSLFPLVNSQVGKYSAVSFSIFLAFPTFAATVGAAFARRYGLFDFLRRVEENVEDPPIAKKGMSVYQFLKKRGCIVNEDIAKALEEVLYSFRPNQEDDGIEDVMPTTGMMIFGPPGTGKTTICKLIAEYVGAKFVFAAVSEMGSTYLHGSSAKIVQFFNEGKKHKGRVILGLDEFDTLVENRKGGSEHYRRETSAFMTAISSLKPGKLFIGLTNCMPQDLDPAVMRPGRVGAHICLALPDEKAREEIFRYYIGKTFARAHQPEIHYRTIAQNCEGFSAAAIKKLVSDSAVKMRIVKKPFIECLQEALEASNRDATMVMGRPTKRGAQRRKPVGDGMKRT